MTTAADFKRYAPLGILATRAALELTKSGGFSVNLAGYSPPNHGYMVALDKLTELKIAYRINTNVARKSLDYIVDHADRLSASPNNYFGGWIDNGYLYLDVATWFDSKRRAIHAAERACQLAIYDCANKHSIYL